MDKIATIDKRISLLNLAQDEIDLIESALYLLYKTTENEKTFNLYQKLKGNPPICSKAYIKEQVQFFFQ